MEGGFFIDHLNDFNLLIPQLTSSSVKIEEEDQCMTLLFSLANSLDHLVMALGSTLVTFRMNDVVSSLLSEETKRKLLDLAKYLLFTTDPIIEGSKMTTSLERIDSNLMEKIKDSCKVQGKMLEL